MAELDIRITGLKDWIMERRISDGNENLPEITESENKQEMEEEDEYMEELASGKTVYEENETQEEESEGSQEGTTSGGEDVENESSAMILENEEVTEEDQNPEETEETEPEIEDLDATRAIPDVTKQDAWHATPGDTQEFNLEEELKAALSGMDEFREQEEAERSASLDPETASEEEIAFEEKTEPITEENTTEESVVEEGSETEAEEPEGDHIDKMLEEAEIQPDISEMTLERETP